VRSCARRCNKQCFSACELCTKHGSIVDNIARVSLTHCIVAVAVFAKRVDIAYIESVQRVPNRLQLLDFTAYRPVSRLGVVASCFVIAAV
jgi:hypothetical protein